MNLLTKIIKIGLIIYLIYIFVFSILIFSVHRSPDKEEFADTFSRPYPNGRGNDRVSLIESPEDGISVRLSLIENANSHLDLAYYKFTDGQVSDLILGSLLDAADRGVKIRILLDGIIQLGNLNKKIDDVFLGFKSHPNIELKLYEPFNPLLPIAWNNRLHDKMILVDKTFALIGGRNIEDRFYLRDTYGGGFVQDRDVLIYHDKTSNKDNHIFSSVIDDMQGYYDLLWQHEYSKPKHKYMSNRKIKKGKISIDKLRSQHQAFKEEFLETYFKGIQMIDWVEVTQPTNGIRFVSNPIGRTNQDPRCLKAIIQLTAEAKTNVFIQSPYIIPSRSIRSLFNEYAIDIEDATLLTNSNASSPNILAISAYKNHKKKLIDNNVHIYEYQGPGSIHGKTAMFDKQISVMGTFNIDPRSSYIDTESMVIIDSESFADTLMEKIKQDIIFSLEVDDDCSYIENEHLQPYPIPKIKNVMITIFSKLTPFIEYLL